MPDSSDRLLQISADRLIAENWPGFGPFAVDFESQGMLMNVFSLPDGRTGYAVFLPRKKS